MIKGKQSVAAMLSLAFILSSCKTADGTDKSTQNTHLSPETNFTEEIVKSESSSDTLASDNNDNDDNNLDYVNSVVYKDPAFYKEENGEKYIRLSISYQEEFSCYTLSDEEVRNLKKGDELKIDNVLTVTVAAIMEFPNWEDPSAPSEGLLMGTGKVSRAKGLIALNNTYYLVHPKMEIKVDGTVWHECNADPELWLLCKSKYNRFNAASGFGEAVRIHTERWVPVSNTCTFQICKLTKNGDYDVICEGEYKDLCESLDKCLPESRETCDAVITMDESDAINDFLIITGLA